MKIFNLLTKYVHSVCIFFIALISLVSFEAVAKDFKEFEPGHTTKEGGNKTVVAKNVANENKEENTIFVIPSGTIYNPTHTDRSDFKTKSYAESVSLASEPPHPLKGVADEVPDKCANDGSQLVKFFLCGNNDERKVTVQGKSVIWQKRNTDIECGDPGTPHLENCPYSYSTCTWGADVQGNDFTIKEKGEYRLSIDGGIYYYFNVFKDNLSFKIITTDIGCNISGKIEVVGIGNSDYLFSLDKKEGPYGESSTFNNVSAGNHTVYIKSKKAGNEGHNCIFQASADIKDESGIKIDIRADEALCEGKNYIFVKVTGGSSSLNIHAERKYPGGDFSYWRFITGNGEWDKEYKVDIEPGKKATYKIIANTGGCTKEEIIDIDFPEDPLKASITVVPISCENGKIIVKVKGGTPPYYYTLDSESEEPKELPEKGIPINTEGDYKVYITDKNHCNDTAQEHVVTVEKKIPEYKVNHTDIDCDGKGGSISIDLIDSKGYLFSYSMDGTNFQKDSGFKNVEPGTYKVFVRYVLFDGAKEVLRCTDELEVTVTQKPPITDFSIVITEDLSCSDAYDHIKIKIKDVVGGTPPYTYSFNYSVFTDNNEGYVPVSGTFPRVIKVRDKNGCEFSKDLDVPVLPEFPTLSFDRVYTCDGKTTVTIKTNKPDYQYVLYELLSAKGNRISQESAVFENVPNGIYLPLVKFKVPIEGASPETKYCGYGFAPDEPIIIVENKPFKPSVPLVTPISCFGANDGKVTIQVTPLKQVQYSLDGGSSWKQVSTNDQNEFTISGLGKQTNLVIKVKDPADKENNCIHALDPVNITEPEKLTLSVKENKIVSCKTVSILLESTGGTGDKTYTLKFPDNAELEQYNNPLFKDVKASSGSYMATVTDAKGCKSEISFEVNLPPPIQVTTEGSDLCYTNQKGATIVLNINGGEAPYQYSKDNGNSWSPSNLSSPIKVENLTPGTYTILVRDKIGCEKKLDPITIGKQLVGSVLLKKGFDCSTLSPNAVITLKVEGGVTPIKYEVSKDNVPQGGSVELTGTIDYEAKDAGRYVFKITDANGCSQTNILIVEVPPLIPLSFQVESGSKIACNGEETGSIILSSITGVIKGYDKEVFNTDTNKSYGNNTTGLGAGKYNITIKDRTTGCSHTETVVIEQNDPIEFDFEKQNLTCTTSSGTFDKKGEIAIKNVRGGVGPYTYQLLDSNKVVRKQIKDTAENYTFEILDFGIYTVKVFGKYSECPKETEEIKIASPPGTLKVDIFPPDPDCSVPGKAKVTVGASVLGDSYHFAVYEGKDLDYNDPIDKAKFKNADIPEGNYATFDNLKPGFTYSFVVYDASTKCHYRDKATTPIPTNSTLTTVDLRSFNVTCKGENDGKVSFDLDKFNPNTTSVEYELYYALSNVTTNIKDTHNVSQGSTPRLALDHLNPGKYHILFKELPSGCTQVSEDFEIKEAPESLTVTTEITKNANCKEEGKITIKYSGGEKPYSFLIQGKTVTPPTITSPWTSSTVFNLNAGEYIAYVKDAYNCIKGSEEVELKKDPSPEITATLVDACAKQGEYIIQVKRTKEGIGPYSYSIDGSAFVSKAEDPFPYDHLHSGSHTIEISDQNECKYQTVVTIHDPLELDEPVIVRTTCDDNDGSVTITHSGGSGTVQYELKKDGNVIKGPQSEGKFEGLASGDYVVVVKDTGTGCSKDRSFTLHKATPVTFTALPTAVSCFGGKDGIITVTVTAGDPPYKYSLDGGTTVQSENIFKELGAGIHKVTVVSERGCKKEEDITIPGPAAALAIDVSKIDIKKFGCTTANDMDPAVITVDPAKVISGGNTDYHLELKDASGKIIESSSGNTNPATVPVDWNIKDIKGGTYTLTVTDSKDCKDQKNIVIEPYDELKSASVEVKEAISCVNTGESVLIKVITSGSTPNPANPTYFEYSKDGGLTWQESNEFSNLPVGIQGFKVRYKDTKCSIDTSHLVKDPNDMKIDSKITSKVACFGGETGEITFSASSATYTGTDFNWEIYKEGVAAAEKTGTYKKGDPDTKVKLKAGIYRLVIKEKDLPQCSKEVPGIHIEEPEKQLKLSVLEEKLKVNCGTKKGIISVNAEGGWGSYRYKLEGHVTIDFSSNNEFRNLEIGSYTVTVKDSEGCEVSENIELKEPDPIVVIATSDKTDLSCNLNKDATITVTVTGASGKIYYQLYDEDGGASNKQTSNKFTNLGAGKYHVVVIDSWECEGKSATIEIKEPETISGSTHITRRPTCKVSGQFEFLVKGGTPPYRYRKVGDTDFNPLPAGSIDMTKAEKYEITDSNTCKGPTLEAPFIPTPELKIKLDPYLLSVGCDPANPQGRFLAQASEGLGDYKYQLLKNGVAVGEPATNNDFNGLAAGTYRVKVISGDCEKESDEIVITDYESVKAIIQSQTNLKCYGDDPVGEVIVHATGGSGKYEYAISPNFSALGANNRFSNLKSGKYTIKVKDADENSNCSTYVDFTIQEPDQIKATHTETPESCKGKADGSITLDISGGTAPYSTRIQGEPSAVEGRLDLVNLKGGDYRIQILDKNGCSIVYNVHLPLTPGFDPIATVTYTCDENNKNSNQVVVSVNPEMKDKVNSYLLYQLSGGAETKVEEQNSNLFSDLSPGTYIVRLSDGNNCNEQTASFEIVAVSPLELKLDMKELNVIVATVSGGVTPYHYYFNDHDNGNRSDYRIKESKTYTVRVVDKAGCKIEENIYGEFIDVHIPNFFTPNDDGHNDTWGPENIQNYPKIKTRIFDRYGREIKTLEQRQTWDGKLNGVSLPSGDYWYIIKLNGEEDTREFVGNITIYR